MFQVLSMPATPLATVSVGGAVYAQIHAVNADNNYSSGKTSWVNATDFALEVGRPPAEHLENPAKFLRLEAHTTETVNSGTGLGGIRTISRTLTLELLEPDIERLLRFCLRNGLVGNDLKRKVRTAYETVRDVARSLSVRLPSRR